MKMFKQLAVKIGEPILLAGYSDKGQTLIGAAKKTAEVVGAVVVTAIVLVDSLPSSNGDAQPFE